MKSPRHEALFASSVLKAQCVAAFSNLGFRRLIWQPALQCSSLHLVVGASQKFPSDIYIPAHTSTNSPSPTFERITKVGHQALSLRGVLYIIRFSRLVQSGIRIIHVTVLQETKGFLGEVNMSIV